MTERNGAFFGLTMVLLYNFLDAGKEVYSGYLIQTAHPMSVTFIVFAIVFLFFQFLCLTRMRQRYSLPLKHGLTLLTLNLTTAGAWITFFYSLRFLEPAVASAIITGLAPLLIVLIYPLFSRTEKREYRLVFLLGIALCSIWLGWLSIQEGGAKNGYSLREVVSGIGFAVACALFSLFSSIFSKKLSNHDCPPETIMAHRFYLTIAITFAFSSGVNELSDVMGPALPGVVLLAILGVIVPLWCLQYAIKVLTPVKVMVFMAVSPAFTFVFQLFDPRLSPSPFSFVAILLLCFFSVATEIWRVSNTQGDVDDGYHGIPENRRS